jgi:CheY-like chemotaxis protein
MPITPLSHSSLAARQPGILVVDDDDCIRKLLGFALPPHGFRAWVACGGEEALRLYQAHAAQIDAALIDIRMPGLDGPAVLAALRAVAPALPCCFMTGFAGAYATEDLLALGAAYVFVKPFNLDELAAVLGRLCRPDSAASPRQQQGARG